MENTIRRPLDLSARQWAALEQIADALGAREPHGRGHNVRVTKWQLVIRGIATGQYVVTEIEPYRLPVGLAEAAAAVEERQREQAVKRKTPVKMQQLSILDLEPA
jgi:hypothetical protein